MMCVQRRLMTMQFCISSQVDSISCSDGKKEKRDNKAKVRFLTAFIVGGTWELSSLQIEPGELSYQDFINALQESMGKLAASEEESMLSTTGGNILVVEDVGQDRPRILDKTNFCQLYSLLHLHILWVRQRSHIVILILLFLSHLMTDLGDDCCVLSLYPSNVCWESFIVISHVMWSSTNTARKNNGINEKLRTVIR